MKFHLPIFHSFIPVDPLAPKGRNESAPGLGNDYYQGCISLSYLAGYEIPFQFYGWETHT